MDAFLELIDRLNAAPPAQRAQLQDLIRAQYGCERAVLALDMSGFSLSVRRDGILSCLCRIRRMQQITAPVVREFNGVLLKYEADNLLAVFEEPGKAVRAAVAMNAAAASAQAQGAALALAIGVDYGQVLLVPHADCFGDPVNIAHKLGEDAAGPGEILITQAVAERLDASLRARLQDIVLAVSGLEIAAYRVPLSGQP